MVTLLRKTERKTWHKQVKNSEVSYAHIWMCVCVYTYIYICIYMHTLYTYNCMTCIYVMPILLWKHPVIKSHPIDTNHEESIHRLMLFYFGGGSKITADGDYSHEIKRSLLPRGEVMTNLGSILKSSNITYNGGVEGHVLSFSCKNSKITTRC